MSLESLSSGEKFVPRYLKLLLKEKKCNKEKRPKYDGRRKARSLMYYSKGTTGHKGLSVGGQKWVRHQTSGVLGPDFGPILGILGPIFCHFVDQAWPNMVGSDPLEIWIRIPSDPPPIA